MSSKGKFVFNVTNYKLFQNLIHINSNFFSEFDAWFDRMQRETYTSWVCERTKLDKGVKTVYYQCNRSGAPRIKMDEERKTDFKGIVSDKTFS